MVVYSSISMKGEHIAPNNTTLKRNTNWLLESARLESQRICVKSLSTSSDVHVKMPFLCLQKMQSCADGSITRLNKDHLEMGAQG